MYTYVQVAVWVVALHQGVNTKVQAIVADFFHLVQSVYVVVKSQYKFHNH